MKIEKTDGGFDPVVFESVSDVLAGGVKLKDFASFKDGDTDIIKAGTLIGLPDDNGLAAPVGIVKKGGSEGEDTDNADIKSAVLGILARDIDTSNGEPWASVVLAGTVRRERIQHVADGIDNDFRDVFQTSLPRFTLIGIYEGD